MILANLRARFVPTDTDVVIELLSEKDGDGEQVVRGRLEREGIDALLDDPALIDQIRSVDHLVGLSPALFLYVTVRHALLDVGVDSDRLSDYLGALLLEFGRAPRANQIAKHDDEAFHYLTDLMTSIGAHSGHRGFLLRAHLGNYALWLAGIFPEYITARRRRKGGPGLSYFEAMGARGFHLASDHRLAQEFDLGDVFAEAADAFPTIRVALNRISDRWMFPNRMSADRLVRQVEDAFALGEG
jgi:hypothetical protein